MKNVQLSLCKKHIKIVMKVIKDRAAYFGLDKTKAFEEFKTKFKVIDRDAPITLDIVTKSIGKTERTRIKKAQGVLNVELNGIQVRARYEQFAFADGSRSTSRSPEGAFVYETQEGVKFAFREKMNSKHQMLTPEQLLTTWQRIPDDVRKKSQNIIQVVDYYNPQDAYWKKRYKNFSHSYMTGGDDIVIYRYDYEHDEDYLVRSFCHEIGHHIDLATNGVPFSEDKEWTKAMTEDKIINGKDSPTEYGKNSNAEDFAESLAEFTEDEEAFEKQFPNRTKLIRKKLN